MSSWSFTWIILSCTVSKILKFCHSLVTTEDGGSRLQSNNNSHNVPNYMSSYPLPWKLNNSVFCCDYVTTIPSSNVFFSALIIIFYLKSITCHSWSLKLLLFLIFVVPSIMLYNSEISPTRCNNCVFILCNGFTLHVSGDNLTHHQEYICCIWPQVSRLTAS